ncbi:hypothetical protein TNCV_2212971 [Trichonephila clavipes]|nr:hypothetical protein TNCV_2212971 [Trichonephila clavipes]
MSFNYKSAKAHLSDLFGIYLSDVSRGQVRYEAKRYVQITVSSERTNKSSYFFPNHFHLFPLDDMHDVGVAPFKRIALVRHINYDEHGRRNTDKETTTQSSRLHDYRGKARFPETSVFIPDGEDHMTFL